jgi:hypothetical protein
MELSDNEIEDMTCNSHNCDPAVKQTKRRVVPTEYAHIPHLLPYYKEGSTNDNRKACVMCGIRGIQTCKTCDVHLCLCSNKFSDIPSCWEQYHSMTDDQVDEIKKMAKKRRKAKREAQQKMKEL